jgi:uroporphyrinogen decarboxylase
MNSKERVHAVLQGKKPDRVPRFEVWIDGLFDELGVSDPFRAYAELGLDAVLMPSQTPPESNAWKTGIDEFGRVWKDGIYTGGRLDTPDKIKQYTPPTEHALHLFDEETVASFRSEFPNHCLFFGTHIGPFMGTYMAMGMERMFNACFETEEFVHAVLRTRTDWCISVFKCAAELGAEVIVMGDDAAHNGGPMISPQMWREFVLPYHQQVVEELPVPVIWHTDGNITKLLPFALETGFAGMHGLEPLAGNQLDEIKSTYGRDLILMGNVDINLFFEPNLEKIRADVKRSYIQGGETGFMISSCNSIYPGMDPAAVQEYFRCLAEYGSN